MKKTEQQPYIMMITSLLIMGSIGIVRRNIPLSSGLIAFCRGVIGSLFLAAFCRLCRIPVWRGIDRKKLILLACGGAFLGINWILLFEAYNYTSVAAATLCYYMEPSILLLVSPLVFSERLTVRKLICACAAVLGMVLISGVSLHEGGSIRGIAYGLAAACFYTFVVITNKKIGKMNAFSQTVIELAASAVILFPYLLAHGDFQGSLNVHDGIMLVIAGIMHTGIAYVLYFGSMSGLKAQTISELAYLDPVSALVFAAVFLQEPLSLPVIAGAVLIIGSALAGAVQEA